MNLDLLRLKFSRIKGNMTDLEDVKSKISKEELDFAKINVESVISDIENGTSEEIKAASLLDDNDLLEQVIEASLEYAEKLKPLLVALHTKKESPELDEESLDEMAQLAEAFVQSGDELLQKQASVIDQILLTIGTPQGAVAKVKAAQDEEIAKIREKYNGIARDKAYKEPKEKLDKINRAADSIKSIEENIKTYRPQEYPLLTRHCPDHPGTGLARVAEATYQCPLDKAIYNYQQGFTLMNGDKVPGGDVVGQTSIGDKVNMDNIFDTRESKINK